MNTYKSVVYIASLLILISLWEQVAHGNIFFRSIMAKKRLKIAFLDQGSRFENRMMYSWFLHTKNWFRGVKQKHEGHQLTWHIWSLLSHTNPAVPQPLDLETEWRQSKVIPWFLFPTLAHSAASIEQSAARAIRIWLIKRWHESHKASNTSFLLKKKHTWLIAAAAAAWDVAWSWNCSDPGVGREGYAPRSDCP